MGLVSELQNLINEHGGSSILRERLAFFSDQINALEKENEALKKQIEQQSAEIHQLEQQIENQRMTEEFVEHRGALFKRKRSGGYHRAVYCPSCKLALASFEDPMPFFCDRCQYATNFSGHDLLLILSEVEREYP